MICVKCKKPLSSDARFCGSCGQPVEAAAPVERAPVPPPRLVSAAPAAAAAATIGASAASSFESGASASMPGVIDRVKTILLSPRAAWTAIAPEATSAAQLYVGYIMPLAALAALMAFIRMSLIGVSLPFGVAYRTPIVAGLTSAVVSFVMGLVVVFIVALIINGLGPTFGAARDQRQALKVAGYSLTPAFLSSVLALSPILGTLMQLLAGLYGIYVLYLGLPIVMRAPRERAPGYTATVVICSILLGFLLSLAGGAVGFMGHSAGLFGSNAAAQAAEQAAAQDQGATAVGNVIGGALGTDAQGKAGIAAALSNLVKAGEPGAATGATRASGAAAASDAPSASGSDGGAQSSVAAVGGLVTALGGALGGEHRVQAVDFKSLAALLPASLPDMKRTSASGEADGALGVKATSATGTYQNDGGGKIRVEITDMSAVSGLIGLAGALVQNTTSESDSGFERDRTINGRSVHEKYDANARHGELTVMLAKRFQVELTGDGVDMGALEKSLADIDLGRLESMKDAGSASR